jgi:hypothetical protein
MYAGAHALSVRGLPGLRPLALREAHLLGIVRAAWLVGEEPAGETLEGLLIDRFWRAGRPARDLARRKHRIAQAAGTLLRRLHDAGIQVRHLSARDLAIAELPSAELSVLRPDLRIRARPLSPRRRASDLVRLGTFPEGHVGASDLLRALRAYAGGKGGEEAWWERSALGRLRRGILQEHLGVLCREGR